MTDATQIVYTIEMILCGGLFGYYVASYFHQKERHKEWQEQRKERDAERAQQDVERELRMDASLARTRKSLGEMSFRRDAGLGATLEMDIPTRQPGEGLSPYLQRAFDEGKREAAAKCRLDEQDRNLRKIVKDQADMSQSLQEILARLDALHIKPVNRIPEEPGDTGPSPIL
jgi:hypothetical protein